MQLYDLKDIKKVYYEGNFYYVKKSEIADYAYELALGELTMNEIIGAILKENKIK